MFYQNTIWNRRDLSLLRDSEPCCSSNRAEKQAYFKWRMGYTNLCLTSILFFHVFHGTCIIYKYSLITPTMHNNETLCSWTTLIACFLTKYQRNEKYGHALNRHYYQANITRNNDLKCQTKYILYTKSKIGRRVQACRKHCIMGSVQTLTDCTAFVIIGAAWGIEAKDRHKHRQVTHSYATVTRIKGTDIIPITVVVHTSWWTVLALKHK